MNKFFLGLVLSSLAFVGVASNQASAQVVTSSITVSPTPVSIVAGATQQLTATALDSMGMALVIQPSFTWTSSDQTIATVDANGLVTGVTAGGPITITATDPVTSITGTAGITVTAPVSSASLTINPITSPVSSLSTISGTSAGIDLANPGTTVETSILDTTASLYWSGSSWVSSPMFYGAPTTKDIPNVGDWSFDVTGLALTANHNYQIDAFGYDASMNTINATPVIFTASNTIAPYLASISVTPVTSLVGIGGTQTFTATALDQNGTPLVVQPTFTWSSLDATVVTVDQTGLATGVAVGSTDITATSGTVSGTATLTVTALPASTSTVAINPIASSVSSLTTISGTSAGIDLINSATSIEMSILDTITNLTWDPTTLTWSASPVVFVSPLPNTPNLGDWSFDVSAVSFLSGNSYQIDASGVDASGVVINATPVTFTFVVPILSSVTVSPATTTLNVGATTTIIASPLDQNGAPFVGASTTWSSSHPLVASVNNSGLVTALSTGTTSIVATVTKGSTTVMSTSLIAVASSTPVVDTVPPVITVLGGQSVSVVINSIYVDAGATALDAVSGIVPVRATGTVNTSVLGTYYITYSATDTVNNLATTTRVVSVIRASSGSGGHGGGSSYVQIPGSEGGRVLGASTFHFAHKFLRQGERNDDVKSLQDFLIKKDSGPVARNLSRVGATGYFGGLTRSALLEYQRKIRFAPYYGNLVSPRLSQFIASQIALND